MKISNTIVTFTGDIIFGHLRLTNKWTWTICYKCGSRNFMHIKYKKYCCNCSYNYITSGVSFIKKPTILCA